MRRIDGCLFLRLCHFLLLFCAIANGIAVAGALYLCSARNMEVAIAQTAERILPALFVGIATGKAQEEGRSMLGYCLAITSFHCSKDTRP